MANNPFVVSICAWDSVELTRNWNCNMTSIGTCGTQNLLPVGHSVVTLDVHPQTSVSCRAQTLQFVHTVFMGYSSNVLLYCSAPHTMGAAVVVATGVVGSGLGGVDVVC